MNKFQKDYINAIEAKALDLAKTDLADKIREKAGYVRQYVDDNLGRVLDSSMHAVVREVISKNCQLGLDNATDDSTAWYFLLFAYNRTDIPAGM